jgi:DNA polymerase alpha subunit A
MKARGGNARSGDVIPYLFCLGEGEESAKSGQAERAKHPDEFRKSNDLKIGKEIFFVTPCSQLWFRRL